MAKQFTIKRMGFAGNLINHFDIVRKEIIDAEKNTLNLLAKEAKKYSIDELEKTYNVRKSEINNKFYTENATRNYLESKIITKGNKLPLIAFGARQNKSGVSVEVVRGRRKTSVGTFITRPTFGTYSGQKHVYVRAKLLGGISSRAGKSQKGVRYSNTNPDPYGRYPIRRLYGLSLPQMFGSIRLRDKLDIFAAKRMPEIFEEELNKIKAA